MALVRNKQHTPPCPRPGCGSKLTQHLGYAVMADHIVEVYMCHGCERSWDLRNDDKNDPRSREMRAEGPGTAALAAAVPMSV